MPSNHHIHSHQNTHFDLRRKDFPHNSYIPTHQIHQKSSHQTPPKSSQLKHFFPPNNTPSLRPSDAPLPCPPPVQLGQPPPLRSAVCVRLRGCPTPSSHLGVTPPVPSRPSPCRPPTLSPPHAPPRPRPPSRPPSLPAGRPLNPSGPLPPLSSPLPTPPYRYIATHSQVRFAGFCPGVSITR